ncbi:MAG: hypothetical protein GY787_33535 [Alteromonadales bacterium]|nr:hypothetical protein [Alteromonadales bacterium]MCP4990118.1 hypothetical protein [Colwellia sp.]
MSREMLFIVLILFCVLNTLVSIFIGTRSDLNKTQKVLQIVLVWLIPIIASIGLWIINRSHDVPEQNRSSNEIGGGGSDSLSAGSYNNIGNNTSDGAD